SERGGGGAGLGVVGGGGFGEQLGEEGRDVCGDVRVVAIACGRPCVRHGATDAAQAVGQAALVFAVAAQVDEAVFVHERGGGGGFGIARIRAGDPARGF